MYFVNVRKKLSSNTFLLHLLPAGTVLIAVLGLTFLGWRNAQQALQTERQSNIQQIVGETNAAIRDKLGSYELMLLGASGTFDSFNTVSRNDWKQFIKSYDAPNNYPGIQGAGYAEQVSTDQLLGLLRSFKNEGLDEVEIFPKSAQNTHVIVKFYEPLNTKALGYDMLTEPKRREAINSAAKTGKSHITGVLSFVRSKTETGAKGFSMYMPVYTNADQRSLPAHERSVKGYVFAPFSGASFFAEALSKQQGEAYALRIYDSVATTNNLLHETKNFSSLDNRQDTHKYDMVLELFGRNWVLEYRFSPDSVTSSTRSRPISSLILGIMLSFLLSGFVLTLLIARTRVLAHSKQLEVQSAKDELLSLASHQLRTPATSVKQYIGMALEGFAGKLSKQQKNLLEKAYESNERQLSIINEILYVAKIDAKGIVLTPRRLNLNKLLRDLTRELSATAKKSRQKIRLQMPMKQVHLDADEHCLRMALENLISNALKYSHEGTTTSIKMTATKDEVLVTVKDKGVGIDQADLPLLFQRFSRIPNELSRQTSGSGIGLYLSQQLVKLHGGNIDVISKKGLGTTFTVRLPKTQQSDKA